MSAGNDYNFVDVIVHTVGRSIKNRFYRQKNGPAFAGPFVLLSKGVCLLNATIKCRQVSNISVT